MNNGSGWQAAGRPEIRPAVLGIWHRSAVSAEDGADQARWSRWKQPGPRLLRAATSISRPAGARAAQVVAARGLWDGGAQECAQSLH